MNSYFYRAAATLTVVFVFLGLAACGGGTQSQFSPLARLQPNAIASDGVKPDAATSGYLYVSSWGSNEVPFYAPGARKPTATISKGVADPSALALDSKYDLYVANNQTDTVTVYAPKSTAVLRTIKTGVHGPEAIVFDGKGNLYVANQTASSITVYA